MKERQLSQKNNIQNFRELYSIYVLKVSPGSVENQMATLRRNVLDLTTHQSPRQIDQNEQFKWQIKNMVRKVKQ